MKKVMFLLLISLLALSCTEDDNEIVGEINVDLEVDEVFEILLSLDIDNETHRIISQADIFEVSEITARINNQGNELNFFTFQPEASYTGAQTVIIKTEKSGGSSTISYNFTID
ncbi:MAG: hypothetical protein ABF274_13190 [Nonlabens sp.]|uniref:hypothetical protein n=1 Tax=Nonlabens sp. TaxID=1888209 RepID=UPI00321A7AB3